MPITNRNPSDKKLPSSTLRAKAIEKLNKELLSISDYNKQVVVKAAHTVANVLYALFHPNQSNTHQGKKDAIEQVKVHLNLDPTFDDDIQKAAKTALIETEKFDPKGNSQTAIALKTFLTDWDSYLEVKASETPRNSHNLSN